MRLMKLSGGSIRCLSPRWRSRCAEVQELMNDLPNLVLRPPLVIPFERAFARDLDAVDLTDPAEVLEQRTVGHSCGEFAVIMLEQKPGDVAAQGASAVGLAGVLSFGTDILEPAYPTLQIAFNQLSLHAAGAEHLIHVQELVAEIAIIDIALDGGQNLWKLGLERNNSGALH